MVTDSWTNCNSWYLITLRQINLEEQRCKRLCSGNSLDHKDKVAPEYLTKLLDLERGLMRVALDGRGLGPGYLCFLLPST